MPMNNISLCFRSTKSPSLPPFVLLGFCWGLVFLPFQAGFTFCSGSFFQSSIVRERKRTPSKSCHFGERAVLSVPSTHTVPVQRGCWSCCPQSLLANSELQLLGTDFAVGKRLPDSARFRTDQLMQLQNPHAQVISFFHQVI